MALGSKVHDRVKAVLLKKLLDKSAVMDIAADKGVALIIAHSHKVIKVAGIGEQVKIYKRDVLVILEHVSDKVGADEPGAAGDEYCLHNNLLLSVYSGSDSRYWP